MSPAAHMMQNASEDDLGQAMSKSLLWEGSAELQEAYAANRVATYRSWLSSSECT